METLNLQDAEAVGGGNALLSWAIGQILGGVGGFISSAVWSGGVDYAGVAEQQGTYYNTVGA